VNGVPVFCRGACWTTMDVMSPARGAAGLRLALERRATRGLNMMRIGGTMAYESEGFYQALR
jgi:beta-mannosidase